MSSTSVYFQTSEINFRAFSTSNISHSESFGRHEFLHFNPAFAVPCLVILGLASVAGTFGNILIILAVATRKEIRNTGPIFIVNLACSDLFITVIADPMSIVAKLEGEEFFNSIPYLCQTIGSICTISCVGSLMSIAVMSLNRYFYICNQDMYRKIFTVRNSVCICFGVYGIGLILVLLNLAGIGDHQFDRKSLECIWDRMATYPYTIVFSFALVWVPLIITGICYLRIYIYVTGKRRKIESQTSTVARLPNGKVTRKPHRSSHQQHLVKALFIIYAVFLVCWTPYALLIVIDSEDSFAHEIHVYITVFAHLHPSLNWLVYYLTNRRFADAFKSILSCGRCARFDMQSSVGAPVRGIVNGNRKIVQSIQWYAMSENIKANQSGSHATGFNPVLNSV